MTWPELLDHIEIKFPFPVEIRAEVTRDEQVRLQCTLHVPDIHTGELTMVHSVDFAPPCEGLDATWYLRNFVLRTLAHELDEGIYVDGARVFDPHRMDPTTGRRS